MVKVRFGKRMLSFGKILRTAHAEGKDPLDLLNEQTQDLQGSANIAAINGYFRYTDCSHKAPVFNRFNVTERAIRKLRMERATGCGPTDGLEYIHALDAMIGGMINAH